MIQTFKEYEHDKVLRTKIVDHMVDNGVPETVARIKVEHMGDADVRSYIKDLKL
jgi:hypothetical protein